VVYFEGSLDKLAGMKWLRSLSLCKDKLRDEDLEFLAKLPELEDLDLYADLEDDRGSLLTDRSAEFLRRAKSLRSIFLYSSEKLTDQFVDTISDLPNLERLSLFGSSGLTDKSLGMLAKRGRHLKYLHLNSKRFTDQGVRELTALKQLEQLSLSSGPLTDACAESIQKLKNLRHLDLPIKTIDDRALRQLASLSKLEILSLRGPPLIDEQFALLGNHPCLESAFLNGSQLTEAKVIEVIKTIPQLKHLQVGGDDAPLQVAVNRALLGRQR
jgi:hypothetical protein